MYGCGGACRSGGGGLDGNETLARMSQMVMSLPMMAVGGGGDAEEFPWRDDRVPQWSQRETRDFIAIRGELERDFNVTKRNKSLWEVVATKMMEIGYRRTPDQCKCKWKNHVC